ncbi:MAG TPA: TlpA disulfide reductase family protein [Xanthomonadaceae bacterium]|nr:TlpA disulfide reductase family protein [Xanthomonadaceae bacterium]
MSKFQILRTAALTSVLAAGLAAASPAQPELSVDTVGGGHFDLASQRGSWVVVNFWATWCSPCLKEMPDLDDLDRRRKDVAVVGLAYEEIAPADLQAFLEQHPVDYPISVVDVFAPPEDFPTPRGLPTTYLIGPDGSVVRHFLGPVTARTLEEAIEEAKASATAGQP